MWECPELQLKMNATFQYNMLYSSGIFHQVLYKIKLTAYWICIDIKNTAVDLGPCVISVYLLMSVLGHIYSIVFKNMMENSYPIAQPV